MLVSAADTGREEADGGVTAHPSRGVTGGGVQRSSSPTDDGGGMGVKLRMAGPYSITGPPSGPWAPGERPVRKAAPEEGEPGGATPARTGKPSAADGGGVRPYAGLRVMNT